MRIIAFPALGVAKDATPSLNYSFLARYNEQGSNI